MVQKCQIGMERIEVAVAKAARWAAEREELQKSLKAKDGMLKEEASRNVGLAADLEQALAEVVHLREEAKEEATQNAHLSIDLDSARAELVWLEEELQSNRRVHRQLISQRNEARGQLEIARKEKVAEL